MNLNRHDLKAAARERMHTAKPSPFLVALVYLLVAWFIQYLYGRITGDYYSVDYGEIMQKGSLDTAFAFHPENISAMDGLLAAALEIISTMIGVGLTFYALRVVRREAAGFANLFDAFGLFFRVLWLEILMSVFAFLWSLLLVVPGIIALYKYRQAIYLLFDHPEWGAYRCIQESKAMMRGHKWELFVLDLSFLGWYILSAFPPVLIYVTPFTELTYAGYYDQLSGRAQNETRTDPNNPEQKPPWEY